MVAICATRLGVGRVWGIMSSKLESLSPSLAATTQLICYGASVVHFSSAQLAFQAIGELSLTTAVRI